MRGQAAHPEGGVASDRLGATRQARKKEDNERGGDSRRGDEREARLHAALLRRCGSDRSRRSQRRRIEQPDDDDRERERAKADMLSRKPAHDRDADRLVEATRQCNTADRCSAAGGGERQRLRTLIRRKQSLPSPRLECVRGDKERACGGEEEWIGFLERPARVNEMESGQRPRGQRARDEQPVEGNPKAPRPKRMDNSPHARRYRAT